jgi:hypothetical protein
MPTDPSTTNVELINLISNAFDATGRDELMTAEAIQQALIAIFTGSGITVNATYNYGMVNQLLTVDSTAKGNVRYFSVADLTLTLPDPMGTYVHPSTSEVVPFKSGDTVEVYQMLNKGGVVWGAYQEFTDATNGARKYVWQVTEDPNNPGQRIWSAIRSFAGGTIPTAPSVPNKNWTIVQNVTGNMTLTPTQIQAGGLFVFRGVAPATITLPPVINVINQPAVSFVNMTDHDLTIAPSGSDTIAGITSIVVVKGKPSTDLRPVNQLAGKFWA